MPFGDAYWSRLLGTMTTEIEALLRAARQDRYTFVDCGANYVGARCLDQLNGIASAACMPPSAVAAVALCASRAQAGRT